MIYAHFIGRIGKDAQIIHGKKGDFMSMDVATTIFSKGEEKTEWVRVRTNGEKYVKKMYQYYKKGKLLLFEGKLAEATTWTDKNGNIHTQQNLMADLIEFLPYGNKKREEGAEPINEEQRPATQEEVNAVPAAPFQAPADKEEDLPF